MPLQKATNSDALMTQYEMHGIEALGLLKFDFLGLSNLTILRQAVDLVKQERGDRDRPRHDPARRPEDVRAAGVGRDDRHLPAGVGGHAPLHPRAPPDVGLRPRGDGRALPPGSDGEHPRLHPPQARPGAVTYLHPLLEPYLEKTYGIFVYQEDIMSAAVALGGFTGPRGRHARLRDPQEEVVGPARQKEKFVTQAAERGVGPIVIDQVFAAFQPFERYGFNKAHATCYGLIAYQTAYLKANYTVEYMTSVLTAFRSNEEKVAAAIAECRRMGIEVLPPDVHRSGVEFTVEGQAIRFGLLAVKNVGQGAIESIIAAREEGGPFRSLTDFCSRVDLRLANRKVLESLARVGALNAFGHPAQILLGLEDAMAAGQVAQHDRVTGQTSLFDLGADEGAAWNGRCPRRPRCPSASGSAGRRSSLGCTSPSIRWARSRTGRGVRDGLQRRPEGRVARRPADRRRRHRDRLPAVITRASQTMGVATLEDLQGSLEVVVFPKLFEQTAATWTEGAVLLVAGRVDHRGEEVSLLADLVTDWDAAVARGPEAFAREVAAGDRGRGRGASRFPWGRARRRGPTNGRTATPPRTLDGPPVPAEIPYVSPLRWSTAGRSRPPRPRRLLPGRGAAVRSRPRSPRPTRSRPTSSRRRSSA